MEEIYNFNKLAVAFCNNFKKYYEDRKLRGFEIGHKTINNIKEIRIIVDRIEEDIKKYNYFYKLIDKERKGNPKAEHVDCAFYFFYNHYRLILDLKSFFIFIRILMDDFAVIIKLIKGKNNLPDSMNDLLEKIDKYEKNDPFFFGKLKKFDLRWFHKMKDDRDKLVHPFESKELEISGISKPKFTSKNVEGEYIIKFLREKLNQICNFIKFLDNNLLKD